MMQTDALAGVKRLSAAYAAGAPLLLRGGGITAVRPDLVRVAGIQKEASINCRIAFKSGGRAGLGNVVQISEQDVLVAPFDTTSGLKIGDPAFLHFDETDAPSVRWLGRVLNPLAAPIDDGPPLIAGADTPDSGALTGQIPALQRGRVEVSIKTGIRAIDIFTPVCYGQRIGIFAGSGVGKSTLLGMLAKTDAFDCVVVALVGERGREVREFVEDAIGHAAMAKTVAVVATSDQTALMRLTAPQLAMRAAEYFRSQGMRVLYLLDSVTRFAHALREIGGAAGEPPVARGYPASVFAELPKLLERAGPGLEGGGSITAIATVLVDGDDQNDPVADAIRGILDGHIVLDREIANQGRYPPINLMSSLSRLANRAWTPEQQKLVMQLRSMIARYEDTRDLRLLGSWKAGDDVFLDNAVASVPEIYSCMIQSAQEPPSEDAFGALLAHLRQSERRRTDAE
jgi:flagellum-specific ATP synthase